MFDEIGIGPVPVFEECQQVGPGGYDPLKARQECSVFIKQLKRQFGEPPDGARFKITSNPHDFGDYYEVAVRFRTDDETAVNFAFKVEDESPINWDDEARKELGLPIDQER